MRQFDSLEALVAACASDPDLGEEVCARSVSVDDVLVEETPGPHAGARASDCVSAWIFQVDGAAICEHCGKRLQFREPPVADDKAGGAWFPFDWTDAQVYAWFRSRAEARDARQAEAEERGPRSSRNDEDDVEEDV